MSHQPEHDYTVQVFPWADFIDSKVWTNSHPPIDILICWVLDAFQDEQTLEEYRQMLRPLLEPLYAEIADLRELAKRASTLGVNARFILTKYPE